MISYGFTMILQDHCIYTKCYNGYLVILSFHADNTLLARNNLENLLSIKDWLSSNFEMNDMGEADLIFGVKIVQRELSLSLDFYINKILK